MTCTVFVLNGPNRNLLGKREPEIDGRETLADVEAACRDAGDALDLAVDVRQTDAEYRLTDRIHEARETAVNIVLDPTGYSHTSVAVADAPAACHCPILEVHISNIHRREEFRHVSYVSRAAEGAVCGFGTQGDTPALQPFAHLIGEKFA